MGKNLQNKGMLIWNMMSKHKIAMIAVVIGVVVTSAMDFGGMTTFSALPLLLLTIIFWLMLRLTKVEIGLAWGAYKFYGIAILYPLVVLSVSALLAIISGDYSFQGLEPKEIVQIGVGSTIGILIVLLTEEGFFRGWLWGALERKRMGRKKTLYLTGFLFMIWHISAVTSGTAYGLPLIQVPVYLINVILLGLIWGQMRLISGSVIVPAVSHAVWNAFDYTLFGFGEKVGALGITNTPVFGPEVGLLGIILNGLFFLWLQWKYKP
jgi:membrane protease YdiL (CAAX protease family)